MSLFARFPQQCRFAATALALASLALPAGAAVPTVIHSFGALTPNPDPSNNSVTNTDGSAPFTHLVPGSDGNWYGATEQGGPYRAGVVFKMHPDGTGFVVLKAFAQPNGTSMNPDGGFTDFPPAQGADGFLYGTTGFGGANGTGTIYKLSRDGQTFVTLHAFAPKPQQGNFNVDEGVMQASDGVLYGNSGGGTLYTLFRMNTDGTGYQAIHTFAAPGSDTLGTNVGGVTPDGPPVEGNDGYLYGDALGGGAHGTGVLFKISKDGTNFTVLHDFDAAGPGDVAQGAGSYAQIKKGIDGAFYGTTAQGGANDTGSIFRIDTQGNFQTIASFPALSTATVPTNTAGAYPVDGRGLDQGPDGTLYGVTFRGGDNGYGTVFAVQPNGGGLTALLSFQASDINTHRDLGLRFQVTYGNNGLLYITTCGGGANGVGAILTLPVPSTHLLWANTNGTAAVWNLSDANPGATAFTAGPYPNWTPKAIAQGPDNKARLLWTNTSGQVALWNLADPNPPATAFVAGPYPNWTATTLTVGPDNAAHLLWDNTDGRVALWNTTDPNPAATALTEGPYSGWAGVAIGIGSDNHERLLWDNTSGQVAVWNLSDVNPGATAVVAGPYNGWTAKRLSVGADNAAHLLWDNVSGQVAVWNLTDANPGATALAYGPYGGWSGQDLSVGADNKGQLLWDNVSGQNSLWNLSDANPLATYTLAGPYSGWTAVSVAAAR
jgi:uncharacterized repeat protein (TIGR03803 family)